MKKLLYILLFIVFVDFSVFAGKGIKRKLEEDDASASTSSASQSKRARKTKDLKDPSRYFNKETIEFFNAAIEAKDKNDHECAIHYFKNFLKNSRCVSRRNLSWIKEALEYLFQNPDESSFLSHYDFLYLPPYSPDFNTIEQDIAIIKKRRIFVPYGTTMDVNWNDYNT